MEMREKINLMLKAALEYNAAVVGRTAMVMNIEHFDRKQQRQAVKDFRTLHKNYMAQLDQILTQLEAEVS